MSGSVVGATRLIPLCIACIATGMYWVTVVYCIRWLVYTDEGWKIRDKIKKGRLFVTLVMFILATVGTFINIAKTFAMVQTLETGIASQWDPQSSIGWTSAVNCAMTNIAVLIADAFLIFRCWTVFERSKLRIVFPILFWIGGLICTVLQLYTQMVEQALTVPAWTPVNMSIGPGTVLTPFWACTIALNIYSTGMIVYRIWKTTSDNQKLSSFESTNNFRFVIRLLVESGLLYLLITIPHFISWWTQSGMAITILSWINVPATCSAFNLITIRTAQHRADTTDGKLGGQEYKDIIFAFPRIA